MKNKNNDWLEALFQFNRNRAKKESLARNASKNSHKFLAPSDGGLVATALAGRQAADPETLWRPKTELHLLGKTQRPGHHRTLRGQARRQGGVRLHHRFGRRLRQAGRRSLAQFRCHFPDRQTCGIPTRWGWVGPNINLEHSSVEGRRTLALCFDSALAERRKVFAALLQEHGRCRRRSDLGPEGASRRFHEDLPVPICRWGAA